MLRFPGEASGVSYAKIAVVQVTARFTPHHQGSIETCAYLLTSLAISSNMICSKFLEPRFYPDRQRYSRNKVPKLSSQVVIAASFVLLMSVLHKYKEIIRFLPEITCIFNSEKLCRNKHTEKLLLCTGTHSR